MGKNFDTAFLALKGIAKLYQNPDDATNVIRMAAIAYRLTIDEGLSEEKAKEIVLRVESTQKYSNAALTLEERVDSFCMLITADDAEMDKDVCLERVLALDDEALAANIDEQACTILSQVVEDFDGGC